MKGFASDNYAGVHPEVLAAIADANDEHATPYGADPWTARAGELLREHFGPEARPFLVFNGSAANVLCLRAMCRGWEAAICAETAHLNVDEAGAAERIAGVKLLQVATADGKLTPADVAARIVHVGDEHAVQPRVVTISQSTELGTCYSVDELRALADCAHERELLLHVDGARLANAAAALGAGLGEITAEAGVDAVSFGGTKNGLLAAEAVVLLRPELADGFLNLRKQTLQLASKGRFFAAQVIAMLEGDLWLRSATHANAMAARLRDALEGVPGLRFTQAVQANALFAVLPAGVAEALQDDWHFYTWDEHTGEVRWMCSWDTTPEEVDAFAAAIGAACRGAAGG
jgi:threonine aldolase